MELVTEENLDPKLHSLYLKAQSAIELLNYDYAISLMHNVLKEEPGFLKCREILRASQGARARGQKKKGGLSLGGGMMKVKNKIKKDPLGAIEDIEDKLDTDPYNADANGALYDAFMALDAPDMATFALRTIRDGHPDNFKNLHRLGDHYLIHGNSTEAAAIYDEIAEKDPSDSTARKKGKDASAQATMKQTGLGSGASFKDLMRNEGEAEDLENAARKGATREQMDARMADLGAQYAADPENLSIVKQIADLYEQLEDWENASSYYDYAFSLSNADMTLQRKSEEARDKLRGKQVADLQAEVDAGGDDVEEKRARLEELQQASLGQMIEEAKERVERNPTDPQLRFELGSHLFTAKDFREAIPHLQKAKNNPHIRIRAMLMLGRCYDAMNMDDLAINTLVEANGELFAMDNTKKEMLYTMGIIYEKVDDKEKSIESFKEIYNVDYDYRDVAERVEGSYTASE